MPSVNSKDSMLPPISTCCCIRVLSSPSCSTVPPASLTCLTYTCHKHSCQINWSPHTQSSISWPSRTSQIHSSATLSIYSVCMLFLLCLFVHLLLTVDEQSIPVLDVKYNLPLGTIKSNVVRTGVCTGSRRASWSGPCVPG